MKQRMTGTVAYFYELRKQWQCWNTLMVIKSLKCHSLKIKHLCYTKIRKLYQSHLLAIAFCRHFCQQSAKKVNACPGQEKIGKMGSSLAGNFVIWNWKNKEIHKENHLTLEGNLPCWRKILLSLNGNRFFQACACANPPFIATYAANLMCYLNKTHSLALKTHLLYKKIIVFQKLQVNWKIKKYEF